MQIVDVSENLEIITVSGNDEEVIKESSGSVGSDSGSSSGSATAPSVDYSDQLQELITVAYANNGLMARQIQDFEIFMSLCIGTFVCILLYKVLNYFTWV